MPRGNKSSYTDKPKRKAEHIEEGYEDRGVSKDEAERRAWATINKESGGGAPVEATRKITPRRKKAGKKAEQHRQQGRRRSVLLPPRRPQPSASATSSTRTIDPLQAVSGAFSEKEFERRKSAKS